LDVILREYNIKRLKEIEKLTELLSLCFVEIIKRSEFDLPGNDGEIQAAVFYDIEYGCRIAFDFDSVIGFSLIKNIHVTPGKRIPYLEYDMELLSEAENHFKKNKKSAIRCFQKGRNYFYFLES